MVGSKHKGWLPEITTFSDGQKKKASRLGILAFEAAKTMSKLVSLYKCLSDEEISRLKNEIIKSQGVSYLTSRDEEFLLTLACAERLETLDRAAAVVSRLGKKCNDVRLNRFDLVYTDLKLGLIDLGKMEYGSKYAEKKVQKMEKLVSATASLHAALEALTEMEITERKMKQRKITENSNNLNQKFDNQSKEVRYYKTTSLWRKPFDKSVGLMATMVIVLYGRIWTVFKPYISVLPTISLLKIPCFQQQQEFALIEQIKEQIVPHSGHNFKEFRANKVRIYSRKSDIFFHDCYAFGTDFNQSLNNNNRVFHAAGPSTLGGSGLALHYANVILLVEKYLDSAKTIGHQERESLYQMLPENLKALVRTKLSKNMKCREDDADLAEGWRAAMIEIMRWLAPLANDTVKWQMERSVEKMKFDSKVSMLLLQTLHFSDKEKTEAAIAEVLVGLSCIYRFENRGFCG